jgi:hypothetical protein
MRKLASLSDKHAMRYAIQPIGSETAKANDLKTLSIPVSIEREIAPFVTQAALESLQRYFPRGSAHVWGVKAEHAFSCFSMRAQDTTVLFYKNGWIVKRGLVVEKILSPELAEHLWGPDEEGETWMCVYFLASLVGIRIPYRKVAEQMGTTKEYCQRFTYLDEEKSARVDAELGGLIRDRLEPSIFLSQG